MIAQVTPEAAALPREHETRASRAGTRRTAARRADRPISKKRNHPQKSSPPSPRSGEDLPFRDASGGKPRRKRRQDEPAGAFEQKVQRLTDAMLAASGGDRLSLAARFRILAEAIAHVGVEIGQPIAAAMPPQQTALVYEIVKAIVEADQARADDDWSAAITQYHHSLERLQVLAQLMVAEREASDTHR